MKKGQEQITESKVEDTIKVDTAAQTEDIQTEDVVTVASIKDAAIKEKGKLPYKKQKGSNVINDILVLRVWAGQVLDKLGVKASLKALATKEEKAQELFKMGFDEFETSVIIGVTEGECKKMIHGTTRGAGTGTRTIKLPAIPTSVYTAITESGKIKEAIEWLLNEIVKENPEEKAPEDAHGFNTWVDKCFSEYDQKYSLKNHKTRTASISVIKQKILLERNALI